MSDDSLLAVIDGLVQGISEFLPISSSAHLYLVGAWWGETEQRLSRIVVVHFGTLIGAGLAMRGSLQQWFYAAVAYLKMPTTATDGGKLLHVVLASLPVLLVGAVLHSWVADLYLLTVVAWTTVLFGLLLAVALYFGSKRRHWEDLTITDALLVGCSQVLALIPGTSRSGICLTTMLGLGFDRHTAARFTVLMSVPVLSGVVLWLTWQWSRMPSMLDPMTDLVAGLVAGVGAWAVVRYGLRYLKYSRQALVLWLCVAWRLVLGGGLLLSVWI